MFIYTMLTATWNLRIWDFTVRFYFFGSEEKIEPMF